MLCVTSLEGAPSAGSPENFLDKALMRVENPLGKMEGKIAVVTGGNSGWPSTAKRVNEGAYVFKRVDVKD